VTETQPQWADMVPAAEEQLADKVGVVITDWNEDRLVATMPVAGNRQPYGLLHGGASAVLAETLGSVCATMHATKQGRIALGLELSCTHHRAAKDGLVTGVCTPLNVGRTVSTFEIVVSDELGRRVCTARLTCVVREQPPGAVKSA
jgi:1,4-dihydroxy-2-naphthoyl-CoA hydrolase